MANVSCDGRVKDEALKFRMASGISINFHISFLKYVSLVRDVRWSQRGTLGLRGMVLSWKMGLCVITGAGKEECYFLMDDPNSIPQKYVVVLRSSLEVFYEIRSPNLISIRW